MPAQSGSANMTAAALWKTWVTPHLAHWENACLERGIPG